MRYALSLDIKMVFKIHNYGSQQKNKKSIELLSDDTYITEVSQKL
jgi:hypothetical protein